MADAPHNDGRPKQFRLIGGEPVLRRALAAFCRHPAIAHVQVAIHPDDADQYAAAVKGLDKLLAPVAGGASRQATVYAGLQALAAHGPDVVLIHDGARPFVSAELIDTVLAAVTPDAGAVPGLPLTDTLKTVRDGRIVGAVDREALAAVQTPQGFPFRRLLKAHAAAAEAGAEGFTDDAGIAERAGLAVALVAGDPDNIKITTARDLAAAEARLRGQGEAGTAMQEYRTGHGYDVHAFAPGTSLVLCGVEIPHAATLKGHSDADVGLHALTDALLGAIADGDIGTHFPPTDPQWQGADSSVFLTAAAGKVKALSGKIVHADVTLICEAPKIGPHREAMREKVAALLSIDISRVSIKATTTEGLGFTGRREGIAAQATATVRLPAEN
jgi:2-C-methyl-D-erythritol 4-phosphate cytidylyltransferase/2-C-methyl-D-erythritol 2,4-cyclodiphosphate synthase